MPPSTLSALHKEGGRRFCHWLRLQRAVPALKAAADSHQCELSVGVGVGHMEEGCQVKQRRGSGVLSRSRPQQLLTWVKSPSWLRLFLPLGSWPLDTFHGDMHETVWTGSDEDPHWRFARQEESMRATARGQQTYAAVMSVALGEVLGGGIWSWPWVGLF